MGYFIGDSRFFHLFNQLFKCFDLSQGKTVIHHIGGGEMGADTLNVYVGYTSEGLERFQCFIIPDPLTSHAGVYLAVYRCHAAGFMGHGAQSLDRSHVGEHRGQFVFNKQAQDFSGRRCHNKDGGFDTGVPETNRLFHGGNAEKISATFDGGLGDGFQAMPVGIGLYNRNYADGPAHDPLHQRQIGRVGIQVNDGFGRISLRHCQPFRLQLMQSQCIPIDPGKLYPGIDGIDGYQDNTAQG
ncbi:MAG: hypothetical protein BWX80_01866 [Candidatus Hydrogenedentes bacterium ADurb.Bin101]|nr:MAG: hypothetical protein BWX80_01866 [Candidatus Hydrogenedentes bacterium ADurb.Bin101]